MDFGFLLILEKESSRSRRATIIARHMRAMVVIRMNLFHDLMLTYKCNTSVQLHDGNLFMFHIAEMKKQHRNKTLSGGESLSALQRKQVSAG